MDSIQEPRSDRVTGVGVLDRCVILLGLLADGPRSLRWLASASGLPRPTAHRLLVALETHRMVARDASGSFRLGPRLLELAAVAGPELDLARLAGPVLASLHEATGESVQLYVRSGSRRLCIAAHDARTGLRDSVPVGALLPLEAGSGGKVLLAWAADRAGFGPPESELAQVRRRGWAASVAEREPGVASVSAPVFATASPSDAAQNAAADPPPGSPPPASPPPGSPPPGSPPPGSPPPASPPPASPPLGSPPPASPLPGSPPLAALCVSGPVSRLGSGPGDKLAAQVVAAAAELTGLLQAES
jgi:DNA-binding IclR family transcriptional regulator